MNYLPTAVQLNYTVLKAVTSRRVKTTDRTKQYLKLLLKSWVLNKNVKALKCIRKNLQGYIIVLEKNFKGKNCI